jgi:hypothetical protein
MQLQSMDASFLTNEGLNSNLINLCQFDCQIAQKNLSSIYLTFLLDKIDYIDAISNKGQIGSIDENG